MYVPGVVVYRFSSRAKFYAHIKAPDWVSTGSACSRVLCGMCDVSAIGRWREVNDQSAIPIHLIVCPKCLVLAEERGLVVDRRQVGDEVAGMQESATAVVAAPESLHTLDTSVCDTVESW